MQICTVVIIIMICPSTFFQRHETEVVSGCAGVQGSLEKLSVQDIQDSAQQWVEEVTDLTNTVEQFDTSHDKLLKGVWSTVETYLSEEIRTDIPTGILFTVMTAPL